MTKTLDEVRKNGFALSDQEFLRGIRAIAVPVFSPTGVAYAINIVVEPEDVSIDELRNKYAPKLIKTGKELSGALGYMT